MKQVSRNILISALADAHPDRPKVFFEFMSDEDLRTEFKEINNEHSNVLRQCRSVEYAR